LRIVYLCSDLGVPVGGRKGASAHVSGLVRAFRVLGHDITVIASKVEEDIGTPVRLLRVPEIVEAIKSTGDLRVARALGHLWNNVAVEEALRDVVSEGRIDMLYERYSPFGVAGSMLAQRLGVPHVLEVNAPLAWEGREYRKQALDEAAILTERAALDSTSTILAVSRELKAALVMAGADPAKVFVMPNGVDVDLFQPEGPSRRDGLDGKLVIGFVGSLKRWHGLDVLADAFRRIASDARLHLLVLGNGPVAKQVDELALELPGRVTRVDAVPHRAVPEYLRAMDIAVAPYPALESFYFSPLKVLEYMAAGRAIIAARIGQVSEVLRHEETGILVTPGDPEDLATAIRRLAGDEELRRSLGRAASLEARREHPWTERAARIVELARGAP
jgi:glycosyltransferase involved in cell wall biosynthesis